MILRCSGLGKPSVDSSFRSSTHREQLSYYEHVLIGNFDYIIFAINDPEARPGLISSMKKFFRPEWRNRALRGNSADEAARIKIDDEKLLILKESDVLAIVED